MADVTVTLVDVEGDPIPNRTVAVYLAAAVEDVVGGNRRSIAGTEAGRKTATTNASGVVVFDLVANADLDVPANSYYKIVRGRGFPDRTFTVTGAGELGSVTVPFLDVVPDLDESALAVHLADTSDAHDASAISVLDTGGNFAATDVEAALAELAAGGSLTNIVDDTTPQLGGSLDAQGFSIENAGSIEYQVETENVATADTLDVSAYGAFDKTMTGDTTFTFANPAPSGDLSSFMLILRGAFTPTFPGSVSWSGGGSPTYSNPTTYAFWTVDGGTTWYGSTEASASDVLELVKTVDGTGSGLDADLLDGQHAAAFQPIDADLTALAAAGNSAVLAATTASFLTADETKLDGIEALADVTDAANVAAAGAHMAGGTDVPVADGGTGASTAATALTNLGATARAQTLNAQTGTTYTLVADDAGKLVTMTNASASTLTVPQDSAATIAVGEYVDITQLGAGQVTVVAGAGATLRVSGLTAKARAQYARLMVQKISANTWQLAGDLAAS